LTQEVIVMTAQELAVKQKQEVAEKDDVRQGRFFQPYVDISEDDAALWVHADVPGVDPAKITIELHNDILTIQGEVNLDEYEGLSPVYSEYNVGHFSRRFRLPTREQFDAERVNARYDDGVLEVQVPKAEKARPRRIEVQTS